MAAGTRELSPATASAAMPPVSDSGTMPKTSSVSRSVLNWT